jgi:hypothetical protein
MRRLAILGVASITTLALATPALAGVATAAPSGTSSSTSQVVSSTVAKKPAKPTIKLKRSAKGVQPGIGKEKITATVNGAGKVKFTIKGTGFKKNKNVKVKNGKAVYKVPPLGTGKYKVTGTYLGKKAKTKFEVYNSALSVNSTTFTFSASADPRTYAQFSGSVLFKNKPADSGYVDIYLDGKFKGGSESPQFLGFTSIVPGGTFNASYYFGAQITKGSGLAGGNLPAFGPGTYQFQAYYTDGPEYSDYISSNFITVVVTP